MNIYIKLFHISTLTLLIGASYGQISLSNASFEGTPSDATIPSGWFAVSEGTTPDILPGYWGVYNEPVDGETYVGLIVRPDGSFESIGQRLNKDLKKDVCYSMSFNLAHSDTYTGYDDAIQIRVWISNKKSKRQQMVFESELIKNEEWQWHKFDFKPLETMRYIIIEAYLPSSKRSAKGNLLIDDISTIVTCNKA